MRFTTNIWTRRFVFVICLAPLGYLIYRAVAGRLGANPIEEVELVTGRWTLRFLLAALAVTPIRRIFRWNAIIGYRRTLGLFAFSYASLHFFTYLVVDQFFDWSTIAADITKRKFIIAGFSAFVLLLPLAITSTNGWIRRLGRRWTTLHLLVYPAAALAITHFTWKVKSDLRSPLRYGAVLAILLGFRVAWWAGHRARRAPVQPPELPV